MNRTAGHALRRLAWDENAKAFRWTCECGHDIGALAVHPARAAWREHKSGLNGSAHSDSDQ